MAMFGQRRKISQETFDECVQENMDEFDMERDEALKDARDQFERQGVDLSGVDLSGSSERKEERDTLRAHVALLAKNAAEGGATLGELEDALAFAVASFGGCVEATLRALKAALAQSDRDQGAWRWRSASSPLPASKTEAVKAAFVKLKLCPLLVKAVDLAVAENDETLAFDACARLVAAWAAADDLRVRVASRGVRHVARLDGVAAPEERHAHRRGSERRTLVIHAMTHHKAHAGLMRQGALALRNFVGRSPEFKQPLLDAGAEAALRDAAVSQTNADALHAALRDLGIDAKVKTFVPDDAGGFKGGRRAHDLRRRVSQRADRWEAPSVAYAGEFDLHFQRAALRGSARARPSLQRAVTARALRGRAKRWSWTCSSAAPPAPPRASSATRSSTRWTSRAPTSTRRGRRPRRRYRRTRCGRSPRSSELPARRLFRGYACVPYFAPTAYALYFGAYEYWSRTAESELLAGFSAEATANPIYIPYDIMKQRFMVGREAEGASVPAAVRGVLERDGLRGMYRGFLLTFATYGPFSAIYFHATRRSRTGAATRRWPGARSRAPSRARRRSPSTGLKTRVQVASETRLSLPKVVAATVRETRADDVPRQRGARLLARRVLRHHHARLRGGQAGAGRVS
ncbi:S-adenosyl-L-methionine transmembrane transporter [Aureococcus anophagefferens]|uniref:S-adenosyl-L-methionine transmembrane transporter n=1 Tax=Aureococcus anophagefferens TaxID=44056 RepID=A0ABR1G7F1_AURAN